MNTFMKNTIRIDLAGMIIGLLPLFNGVSVSGGRATDRMRARAPILYDPTRRSTVRLAGAQRPLVAGFAAPFAYHPNLGLVLGLAAMMRPQNYEQRTGLYVLEPYDSYRPSVQ